MNPAESSATVNQDEAGLSVDHVVIAVSNLEQAAADFRSSGWLVIDGGRHAGSPTANALIPLADGVYLELLAVDPHWLLKPLQLVFTSRLGEWLISRMPFVKQSLFKAILGDEGIADFALRSSDIHKLGPSESDDWDQAIEMSRKTEQGESKWLMKGNKHPGLPFVIQDLTPVAWRVPTGVSDNSLELVELQISSPQPELLFEEFSALGAVELPHKSNALSIGSVVLQLSKSDGDTSYEMVFKGTDKQVPSFINPAIHLRIG